MSGIVLGEGALVRVALLFEIAGQTPNSEEYLTFTSSLLGMLCQLAFILGMDGIEITGYVAAGLSMIATIPDMVKIIRTKETAVVSYYTYSLMALADITWLIYASLSKFWPVVISDSVALVFAIALMFFKWKYESEKASD